ncbi:hypothetical protein [Alkalicoccobacillus plakortidis]|uniref:Uncharacterized protein n=1 Tax=Alkalicoccobacillus plakortidis TaxID=444060 RepID=A0ABT0XGD1_9BACI|nr:hypothetical protein [Alkalicoccobacillus plakortidis]MCM2674755.1 hypothetical protein [Alkalicoccobacillus plakortidis]
MDKPSSLLSLLEPLLRESLQNLDYQLSSVSWKTWTPDQVVPSEPQITSKPTIYQGMDIRI